MLYELQGFKKTFGQRTVLDIPHLVFESRKVYALIGANGAGKTTLLNQLAFLDSPTAGDLFFHGQQVIYEHKHLTQCRKHVVLVDQTPILFSGTVWRNVEFGLKVRNIARAERSEKVVAALERVGMADFALSDIHGLSGGEVKRVALARALAVDPDVLLCDEPTANVDQQHQEIILEILRHVNSVRNTSVIFSTHYLSQSRRLADQTILLQNGKLSHEGGENTIDATVIGKSGGKNILKISDNCHLSLSESIVTTEGGRTITIHLVPEKIGLYPAKGDDRQGCTGIVRNIGKEEKMVRITVDMGRVVLTVLMEIAAYKANPPLAGQTVRIDLPEEAVVVMA